MLKGVGLYIGERGNELELVRQVEIDRGPIMTPSDFGIRVEDIETRRRRVVG